MPCSTKTETILPSRRRPVPLQLVRAAAALLRRVAGSEPALLDRQREIRLAAHLRFCDGIGRAEVVASLFNYRGSLRLDLWIEHDRVFARGDGSPSTTPCFLNDFVASTRLSWEASVLPATFVRDVENGVGAARDGVARYNARCRSHWFRVFVTARP